MLAVSFFISMGYLATKKPVNHELNENFQNSCTLMVTSVFIDS